jgi:hypothetical protein
MSQTVTRSLLADGVHGTLVVFTTAIPERVRLRGAVLIMIVRGLAIKRHATHKLDALLLYRTVMLLTAIKRLARPICVLGMPHYHVLGTIQTVSLIQRIVTQGTIQTKEHAKR